MITTNFLPFVTHIESHIRARHFSYFIHQQANNNQMFP